MNEDDRAPYVRNIGIMAHIDAGKTTTTERILYCTGKIHRMGEVHDGTATTDFLVQEQERGITIMAAAVSCPWGPYAIQLIDTPGHVDFTVEVERALRVLDGAILLLDGVHGVEPQTETVWRQAQRYGVPRLVFVNKMDRLGANFQKSILSLEKRLNAVCGVLQIPLGSEDSFVGVVDLLTQESWIWKGCGVTDFSKEPVHEEFQEDVALAREGLWEVLAELDDEFMEAYLDRPEDWSPEVSWVQGIIRRLTLQKRLIPVLCGSAFRGKGIQPLLDAVCAYLPAPTDLPPVEGMDLQGSAQIRKPQKDESLSLLVFKLAHDGFLGMLAYGRIYSGTLIPGQVVFNVRTEKKERIQKIFRVEAHQRTEISQASVGDIVAFLGPKQLATGDTLSDIHHPIGFEPTVFPEPVVYMALEAETMAHMARLNKALERLLGEDPSLKLKEDKGTGQLLLGGMGELHLDILLDRLKREFGVNVRMGHPQVAYKEALKKSQDFSWEYQPEPSKEWIKIQWTLSPSSKEGVFLELSHNPNFTPEMLQLFRKGCEEACGAGNLVGFPVFGVNILVTALSFDPNLGSQKFFLFHAAAYHGIRHVWKNSPMELWEPWMSLEVSTPENYVSPILQDLQSRRARVENLNSGEDSTLIKASVPLAEMFGYTTQLRSLSQGRASETMIFQSYESAPDSVLTAMLH